MSILISREKAIKILNADLSENWCNHYFLAPSMPEFYSVTQYACGRIDIVDRTRYDPIHECHQCGYRPLLDKEPEKCRKAQKFWNSL